MDWYWIGIAITTVSAIVHGLKTVILAVLGVAFFLVRLATYPISALWAVLLFVLGPVIYTIRFLLSPLFFMVNNFPRLEPIYLYFGSAAFVGIAFGLVFTLASSSIVSILGLYDSPTRHHGGKTRQQQQQRRRPSPPPSPPAAAADDGWDDERRELEDLQAQMDYSDDPSVLAALEAVANIPSYVARDDGPAAARRKRRSAAALRIGTILEEDDDSL